MTTIKGTKLKVIWETKTVDWHDAVVVEFEWDYIDLTQ